MDLARFGVETLSKRPGHLAGPYRTTEEFVRDYAHYRGRSIVSHRVTESYARRLRVQAARQPAPARHD